MLSFVSNQCFNCWIEFAPYCENLVIRSHPLQHFHPNYFWFRGYHCSWLGVVDLVFAYLNGLDNIRNHPTHCSLSNCFNTIGVVVKVMEQIPIWNDDDESWQFVSIIQCLNNTVYHSCWNWLCLGGRTWCKTLYCILLIYVRRGWLILLESPSLVMHGSSHWQKSSQWTKYCWSEPLCSYLKRITKYYVCKYM